LKVKKCKAVPIEIVVRNYAYGSFLKRMPLVERLKKFSRPIVELHYKSDELHDPLILEEDVLEAGILSEEGLKEVRNVALRVNEVLSKFWSDRGLRLIDFKIEVGWSVDNNTILVIDDLSGDAMRVLTPEGEHLDKEVYRRTRDTRLLMSAYTRLSQLAGEPSRFCP